MITDTFSCAQDTYSMTTDTRCMYNRHIPYHIPLPHEAPRMQNLPQLIVHVCTVLRPPESWAGRDMWGAFTNTLSRVNHTPTWIPSCVCVCCVVPFASVASSAAFLSTAAAAFPLLPTRRRICRDAARQRVRSHRAYRERRWLRSR